MQVIALTGSPNRKSRSSSLVEYIGRILAAHHIPLHIVSVNDIPPADLIGANFKSKTVRDVAARIGTADAVIVSTPVYKAAYSGALKTLLDLLPERALADKIVLPIATGGSTAHMLAVDYALKPVLSALKARQILNGVFATDEQVAYHPDGSLQLDSRISQRLDDALERLLAALHGVEGRVITNPNQLNERLKLAQFSV